MDETTFTPIQSRQLFCRERQPRVTSGASPSSCSVVIALLKNRLPLALIAFASAVTVLQAASAGPEEATAEEFWGLTNLYTFHLIITPEEWKKMETYETAAGEAPGERRPGGFGPEAGFGQRGGFGPGGGPGQAGGPQRGPGMGMMGLDFPEGEARLEFQGKEWGTVNVRFKGNSSFRAARDSLKRSFKLDFNDADESRSFYGMTKLNLNNGAMDPGVLREALGYDVFRQAGVPASRTAFARVFLTVPGEYERAYAGLYTVVEQVDGKFLKAHFGGKSGLLLKPERVQGLPYLGEDWQAYERQFEEKSNVKPKEAKRFIAFARLVNQATDAEFAAQVRSFMEVEAYLRFIAAQAALANLDSPLLTGHNYYLYLDPTTDKLAWIPWDLNEAFGGFMGGGTASNMVNLSIHRPFSNPNRLTARVLALDGATQQYDAILRGLIETNFNAQRLGAKMDTLAKVLRDAVREDKQLSLAHFERHLSAGSGPVAGSESPADRRGGDDGMGQFPGGRGGVGFGPMMRGRQKPLLRQFVAQRVAAIEAQLAGKSEGYVPTMMNPRGGAGPMGQGRPGPGGPGGEPPGQPRPFRGN
jgi:spore coat protein H